MECLNCKENKLSRDNHRGAIKKMIKSLPKSLLTEILIEMKILKQDYLTNEISLN